MAAYILSYGLADSQKLESLRAKPEFRKATRNMLLSSLSVAQALAPLQDFILQKAAKAFGQDCGLVLGSGHGELEVTLDFLKTLAETQVARPILFQNSLHHSTAGFMSLQLNIQGPAMTVSQQFLSGENALDMGMLLVSQKLCRFCLVTGVDSHVPELIPGAAALIHNEGAASLLLTDEEGVRQSGLKPIAELLSLEYFSNLSNLPNLSILPKNQSQEQGFTQAHSTFKPSYESDAIEHLIAALQPSADFAQGTSRKFREEEEISELRLTKFNQSGSLIRWRRVVGE